MDCTCCLRCFSSLTNGPTLDFVRTTCEKVLEVQTLVTFFNDHVECRLELVHLVLCLTFFYVSCLCFWASCFTTLEELSFECCTVRHNWLPTTVFIHPLLERYEEFV